MGQNDVTSGPQLQKILRNGTAGWGILSFSTCRFYPFRKTYHGILHDLHPRLSCWSRLHLCFVFFLRSTLNYATFCRTKT